MASDARQAWLSRVLGFDLPAVAVARPELDSPQDLSARLADVIADVKVHGANERLAAPLRAAVDAVKQRASTAADMVSRLEDQLAAFIREKRAAGVQKEVKATSDAARVGIVNFAKLRLQLAAARGGYATAVANLQTACSRLLTTPAFVGDPRSAEPATLGAVDDVASRVPDIETLAGDVEDLLDRMMSTPDAEARRALSNEALDAIEDYRAALDADPLLTFMESTAAGALPIHAALTGALGNLAGALQA